jgi:hypothetical protein
MDKIKCPLCYTEVEERSFKETYVPPYNSQEYKRYERPKLIRRFLKAPYKLVKFYRTTLNLLNMTSKGLMRKTKWEFQL